MTFRVKVNQPSGPKFYYALGNEGLDALLDELYSAGPINVFVARMK